MKKLEQKKQEGSDLIKQLIAKAWENPEFKNQLVQSPTLTISEFIGKDLNDNLPNNKKIVFDDQTDNSMIFLNIPKPVDIDDIVLTEEELERVAGGEEAGCSVKNAGIAVGNAIVDGLLYISDLIDNTFTRQ